MNNEINISWQLEIIDNNKILIPGCEPTSSMSSRTLSAWMSNNGCGSALVDINQALEAIPGSWIKYGNNFNRLGYRQKWFVFPSRTPECPCIPYPDYYKILKDLSNNEEPITEDYDSCNLEGMGYCPSPDFNSIPAPPSDPYIPEHVFPSGVSVLPPLPPWNDGLNI